MHIIRASERSAFQRCQAMWWWKYREGLVPRRQPLDARWFGTGVHVALAAWYCGPGAKRGPEPAETFGKFAAEAGATVKVADATDEEVARFEDAADLGRTMLDGYVAQYGRDEHMSVIQPEQTFRLEIPWPAQDLYDVAEGDTLAAHVGTYDLPWRDLRDGSLWIEEHKTARTVSTAHLALDNQGGTYWAVATAALRDAGLIGPRESLKGIQYNFLRKGLPDDRPRDAQGYACNKPVKADYVEAIGEEWRRARAIPSEIAGLEKKTLKVLVELAESMELTVLGERSKIQPPPLFVRHDVHRTKTERRNQLERIQAEALHMRAVRDGLLPVTKSPMRDCNWCDFYAMCELQERGGNWQDFRRLQFKQRDPYADHHKSTSEEL